MVRILEKQSFVIYRYVSNLIQYLFAIIFGIKVVRIMANQYISEIYPAFLLYNKDFICRVIHSKC